MARINHILMIFSLLLITFTTTVSSRSPARGDLIDGNEFLSLFMGQMNKNTPNNNYDDDLDESTPILLHDEEDIKESIVAIDSILSTEDELLKRDSKNYGLRLNQKQNFKSNKNSSSQYEPTTTRSPIISNGFHNLNGKNNENTKKQIVKLVTSGSKIVFLEEIDSSLSNNRNKSRGDNSNGRNHYRKLNSTTASNHKTKDEEVQVISIRVSSTVGKSRKQINTNSKPDDLASFAGSPEPIQRNDNLFEDNNGGRNDFINRSHKSEFSIEELEPVTQQTISDSVNGESTNIHSIVAPPKSRNNQSPLHHTTATAGIGRTQRKHQDKLVPFQTVIYHDTGYNKDGNAQPRSVSYSSLAQSVDDLETWKDLDTFLEAKKNVSEGLNQSIRSDPPKIYNQPEKVYSEPAKYYSEPSKMYGEPSKFYSEPAKVYSEPAKIYGQPEKQYSQPAKVYSEPSKVYAEPAKVYSEPAKMYGEPSKVYWPQQLSTTTSTTTSTTKRPILTTLMMNKHSTPPPTKSSNSRRIIFNLDKLPYDLLNAPESSKPLLEPDPVGRRSSSSSLSSSVSIIKTHSHHHHQQQQYQHNHDRIPHLNPSNTNSHRDHLVTENPNKYALSSAITESNQEIFTPTPEQNYEIEESVSVMTNGRAHGIHQLSSPSSSSSIIPTASPIDDSKVGYVVEGRNYRKYRVEEKTPDGFIVGEYGVVSHNDGSLRGVRYTADSNINPSLIHEALMKFLSL